MRYNEGERKRRTKGNFRLSVALTGMKKDLEMRRNKTLDPKKTKYKEKRRQYARPNPQSKPTKPQKKNKQNTTTTKEENERRPHG